MDDGASFAFTLPSNFAPLGETMRYQQQRDDRQKAYQIEQDQQNTYREQQEQQKNRMYNLNAVDKATDAKDYQTGEAAFDNYSNAELSRIQEKALTDYINLSPEEMKYRLSKDMQGFINWHSNAKGQIKQINAQLQDFNKTYPNVDAVKAHDRVFTDFARDFMQQDPQTGQWQRKPIEFIKPRDYFSELQKPSVLGEITNDVSPLSKFFQGRKVSNVGEKDYKNNKGKVISYKWSGAETDLSERVKDKDGKVIGMDMKYQPFDLGGGKTLKLIPDEAYDEIVNTPAAKAAASKLWNVEKQRKGLNPSNEVEEELLFKNFLYEKGRTMLPHGFKTEEIEKTPVIKVSVNGGGSRSSRGSSNGTVAQINDAYGRIASKAATKKYHVPMSELDPADQLSVLEYARKISGDNTLSYENVYIGKEKDGSLTIRSAGDDDAFGGNGENKDKIISPLPYLDINMSANKSLGVKAKNAVVSKSKEAQAPAKAAAPTAGFVPRKM